MRILLLAFPGSLPPRSCSTAQANIVGLCIQLGMLQCATVCQVETHHSVRCAGLFKTADKDQSGTLDRNEFAAVLSQADLGLPERLINTMLAEADDNADGVISYGCAALCASICECTGTHTS